MGPQDDFTLEVPLFGGEVTDVPASAVPAGASPACSDMFFGAQYAATRPAWMHTLAAALSENGDVISHLDFPLPTGATQCVILYDDGSLWLDNVQTNSSTQVGSVIPGIRFKGIAAFGKFFMAFRSLSLTSPFTYAQLAGGDTPRYINALGNLARVVTDGPGGGFSVTGVNIGPEDLVTPGTFAVGPDITSIVYGGVTTVPIQIRGGGTIDVSYYTTATVTLASAQSLSAGQIVQMYSIEWANAGGPQWANGVPVKSVTDSTHFVISITPSTVSNSASGGIFAYGNASNVSLNRVNNNVTAYLAGTSPESPTAIQPGWFVTLTDTQAATQAELPNGTVPFTANELFQAIYPSAATSGAVAQLIEGAQMTFYTYQHVNGGAFNFDFPGDGFNEVLPAPIASYTFPSDLTVMINPNGNPAGSFLPGAPSGQPNPWQMYGVTTEGEWDNTTVVPYAGATTDVASILSGQMSFPVAGTYVFYFANDDGAQIGFEKGVTRVSGTGNAGAGDGLFNPQPHTVTALNGYPIVYAANASTEYGGVDIYEGTVTVTVAVPGVYGFEANYVNWEGGAVFVMANYIDSAAQPIIPTVGPASATVQGDGVGNVHVTLPTAVEDLSADSWLYLYLNTPTPSYITQWVLSSNGTGLITVPSNPNSPNTVWPVNTEILLGGFTSVSNPEPTGWNGQTVVITAVDNTNPAAPVYQFAWTGPAGSGTSTTGTATPVSAPYPQGWIQVTQVISTTEFVYQAVNNTSSQAASGVVYDYFGSLNTQQALTANAQQLNPGVVTESTAASSSGIVQGFQVLTVDTSTTPNTITWYQQGFNDTYTGTHLLQVQPQSSVTPGPHGAFCFFINEDGGFSPGSYPINLQLNGGTQFPEVTLPVGPPGTSGRGVAYTTANGTLYIVLSPSQIPATAGQAPIITLGTIVNDNTTTSLIMDFSDAALTGAANTGGLASGANAVGGDYGDLTSTIVLPPCIGVVEYDSYLIWWGELNNYPNHSMINMGMSGGYTPVGSPPALSGAQPNGWNQTALNSITPSSNGTLVNSDDGLGLAYQMTGSTGNLNVVIYSPSAGVLASCDVPFSLFTASVSWQSATFSAAMPASIPQDAQFYLTASTGNNNMISQGAWQDALGDPILLPLRTYVIRFKAIMVDSNPRIWDLQLIDAAQPVLSNQLRVSYEDNEFGYDNENGFVIGLDTTDFLASLFLQKSFLYANTENELHTIQNNGQVPSEWPTALHAKECGSSGPDAVCTGAVTAWWMGRHGVQAFDGAKPKKISEPEAQRFEQSNWNAAVNSCIAYDAVQRVLYMSFPIGLSTNPNFAMTMSSRLADASINIPDPVHVSAYTGKMIATDLGQKWSPMSLPINSMQMCKRNTPNGYAKVMTFGGGKAGPVSSDVTSTAQSASGDVIVSLTPENPTDFVMVCTSAYATNTDNTPGGWTREGEGFYTTQVSNTDELTFDLPSPSPASWTALMLSFESGEPTLEQIQNVDFGTYPNSSYTRTFNVNANDAIIYQVSMYGQSNPTFDISDSSDNVFIYYQNTQNIGGVYYTSFLAVALGCKANSANAVTLNIGGIVPAAGGFVIYEYAYSGIIGPVGYGQLYIQDFWNYPPVTPDATEWNCVDADYGNVPWDYYTYFFYAHDAEQQQILGHHRKLFGYMDFHAIGSGYLGITPYVDALNNPWTSLPTYELQIDDPGIDYGLMIDVRGERMSLKFQGVTPPVQAVTITPDPGTVHTNDTLQFSDVLTGFPDLNVVWSCTGGTITQTGLFTAGGTTGTFSVTCTAADDSSVSATAPVTITGGYGGD